MDKTFKTAMWALATALLLAVAGDWLLPGGPWGINGCLWVAALAGGVLVLVWTGHVSLARERRWFLGVAVAFGVCLAWRASITLKSLDLAIIGLALTTLILREPVQRVVLSGMADYVLGLFDGVAGVVTGLPRLVLTDARLIPAFIKATSESENGFEAWRRHVLPFAIGCLLSVPLLLLFGALLSSADAAFRAHLTDLLDFDFEKILEHGIRIVVCCWMVAGFLRVLAFKVQTPLPAEGAYSSLRCHPISLAVPLASLDLLFLAFVAVQFRYFFGGHDLIAGRTGLTYSAYAREGFFQLVAVSALVLALLLSADWLARGGKPRVRGVLNGLAVLMVALVYIMMASAIQRMRIYQEAYGLTELRLYTTVFMLWLAVVFAWLLGTVTRGRRDRFAFGALVTAMVFVFGLHVFNPDSYIVRTNVARQALGKTFDAKYAASLSVDAIPSLAAALPDLDAGARSIVEKRLEAWVHEDRDWRTTTWSHRQALRSLASGGQP